MALRGGGAAQMHDQFARDNTAIAERLEAVEVPLRRRSRWHTGRQRDSHAEQAEALRRWQR